MFAILLVQPHEDRRNHTAAYTASLKARISRNTAYDSQRAVSDVAARVKGKGAALVQVKRVCRALSVTATVLDESSRTISDVQPGRELSVMRLCLGY